MNVVEVSNKSAQFVLYVGPDHENVQRCTQIFLFYARDLKLGHFSIFDMLFLFLAFFKLQPIIYNIFSRDPRCKFMAAILNF